MTLLGYKKQVVFHYGIFAFRPESNQNTQRILLSLNMDLHSIAIMIHAENRSLTLWPWNWTFK